MSVADDGEIDPLADPEERRVLYAALDSFRQYRKAVHYNVMYLRRKLFHALPYKHSELLSGPPFNLLRTFQAVDDAIDHNADIAEAILEVALHTYGVDSDDWKGTAQPGDMDKAKSTINQLYRDFSKEGAPERTATFAPMIEALNSATGLAPAERHATKVLIPGSGLGRLLVEVCAAGYTVEGNEISYHQLMASNWILNCQTAPEKHPLFPWALSFSNHTTRANQLQECLIPDITAGDLLQQGMEETQSPVHAFQRLSMASGDFCVLYRQPEYRFAFDAVLTCFFIDTAPNVLAYLDTINYCLRPGGIWVNMGPLLWHFEGYDESQRPKADKNSDDENQGIAGPGSVELTDEEVLALVQSYGFTLIKHDNQSHSAGYIHNPKSMVQHMYRPSFWVMQKHMD